MCPAIFSTQHDFSLDYSSYYPLRNTSETCDLLQVRLHTRRSSFDITTHSESFSKLMCMAVEIACPAPSVATHEFSQIHIYMPTLRHSNITILLLLPRMYWTPNICWPNVPDPHMCACAFVRAWVHTYQYLSFMSSPKKLTLPSSVPVTKSLHKQKDESTGQDWEKNVRDTPNWNFALPTPLPQQEKFMTHIFRPIYFSHKHFSTVLA